MAAMMEVKCVTIKGTEIEGMIPRRKKVARNCPGLGSYLLYIACVTCRDNSSDLRKPDFVKSTYKSASDSNRDRVRKRDMLWKSNRSHICSELCSADLFD